MQATKHTTTIIVEPRRLGWLCTCGQFWYQAQSVDQAKHEANNHRVVIHGDKPHTIKGS